MLNSIPISLVTLYLCPLRITSPEQRRMKFLRLFLWYAAGAVFRLLALRSKRNTSRSSLRVPSRHFLALPRCCWDPTPVGRSQGGRTGQLNSCALWAPSQHRKSMYKMINVPVTIFLFPPKLRNLNIAFWPCLHRSCVSPSSSLSASRRR